jgi:hypothetical protein
MARRANAHRPSARARPPARHPPPPPAPIVTAAATPSSSPASPEDPSAYTSGVDDTDASTDDASSSYDPNKLPLAALSLSDSAVEVAPVAKPRRRFSSSSKPFPFLDLPSELRLKIYEHHFASVPRVLDLDPDNQKRVRPLFQLLRTCRLVREEAGHLFWSTHVARVFPTHPGRFFKTKKPLLARMKPHQRASLTTLEVRLGPGWSSPPRGWVVNDALGLRDCVRMKKVIIFVECDPSDGIFKGFRQADGFYEGFCRDLVTRVLDQLPTAHVIEFDAWPSVKKSGAMMRALLSLIRARPSLLIRWGPGRGWTDAPEEEAEGNGIEIAADEIFDVGPPSVSFAGYGPQSIMVTA